jgi:hypothetical protein
MEIPPELIEKLWLRPHGGPVRGMFLSSVTLRREL